MAEYRHADDILDPFDLTDAWGVRQTLRTGLDSDPPPGAPEPEPTDEVLRAAWERIGAELVAEVRAEDPGCRPEGYWRWEAPSDPAAGGQCSSMAEANELRLPALLDAGEVDDVEVAELFEQATPATRTQHDAVPAVEARRRVSILRTFLTNQTDGSPIGDRTSKEHP